MSDVDLDRLLSEPIYGWDFQYLIGDIEDFLDFSESRIAWQYRRELRAIDGRAETEGFPEGYKKHLQTNAEHRFKVSLPLRVRYGAVVALTTSVEWSVSFLVKRLNVPLSERPKGRNETVHGLFELQRRTGVGSIDAVLDYEALVHVRNCIAHSARVEEGDQFRDQLAAATDRLSGFSLGYWRLLGRHICINEGALTPYVRRIADLVIALHRAAYEQDLLRKDS